MDIILPSIPKVTTYFDNIVTVATFSEKLRQRTKMVSQRISDNGFLFRLESVNFCQTL